MASESIVIVVTEDGSRVVKRNLEDLGRSASSAADAVTLLKEALAAVGIGLAINELVKATDEYTNAINRLVAVGTPLGDVGAAYQRLYEIALETHNSLGSTVNLYARMEQGLRDLGYSQRQVITFTEELSAAFSVSGATSQELKYAMQDLAHGIAAGSINAREMNGILRETPNVANLIAKSLGVTTGQLKEMTTKGSVSADALIQGFSKLHDEIMGRLEARIITIGNGFQDIKTSFDNWIGSAANSTGVLGLITSGLEAIAHNMDTVMKSIVILGSGFAVLVGVPAILRGITVAFQLLNAVMLANPFLFILSAITAVVAYLVTYRNSIKLGIDDITTLGDLMKAAWEAAQPLIQNVTEKVRAFIQWVKSAADSWREFLQGQRNATANGSDFVDRDMNSWILTTTKTMDTMVAIVKYGWFLVIDSIRAGIADAEVLIAGMADMIAHVLVLPLNAVITAYNFMGKHLGAEKVETIQPDLFSSTLDFSKMANQRGAETLDAFVKGVTDAAKGHGGITQSLMGLFPRAQDIAKDRLNQPPDTNTLDEKGPRHAPEIQGLDKLHNQLTQVEDKWDHVLKAINEYNKAVDVMNKSVAAGLISRQDANTFLGFMTDEIRDKALGNYDAAMRAASKYKIEVHDLEGFLKAGVISQNEFNHAMEVAAARAKDAIAPFAAVTREIQRQMDVGKLLPDQQQIENKLHQEEQALLQKGILLRNQSTGALNQQGQALKALITQEVEDNKVNQIRNQLYQQIVGPQENLKNGTKALNEMLQQGVISTEQYTKALGDLKYQALAGSDNWLDGLQRGIIKFGQSANDLASGMEKTFTDAMDNMNSAIINFAETGQFNFHKLAQSVLEDIATMILKWLEWQAMKAALSALGMAGFNTGGSFVVKDFNRLHGFADGGSFMVGGGGGTDSQLVAFRASPDERVTITKPGQPAHNQSSSPVVVPAPQIKIVNSIDPRETLAHMNTSAGERIILNVIQRNPTAVKRAIG